LENIVTAGTKYRDQIEQIPGLDQMFTMSMSVSFALGVQAMKERIDADTLRIINKAESLLQSAIKNGIGTLDISVVVYTDMYIRTKEKKHFQGTPQELLEGSDIWKAICGFNALAAMDRNTPPTLCNMLRETAKSQFESRLVASAA
jgi:hypothetical protein